MRYHVTYHLIPRKRARGKHYLYLSCDIEVDDPALALEEAKRTIEENTSLQNWEYSIDSLQEKS